MKYLICYKTHFALSHGLFSIDSDHAILTGWSLVVGARALFQKHVFKHCWLDEFLMPRRFSLAKVCRLDFTVFRCEFPNQVDFPQHQRREKGIPHRQEDFDRLPGRSLGLKAIASSGAKNRLRGLRCGHWKQVAKFVKNNTPHLLSWPIN